MAKEGAGVHSGSSFDDFLEEEGYRNEVESIAVKRVLAWQFEQEMVRQQKTKKGDGCRTENEPFSVGPLARSTEHGGFARHVDAGSPCFGQAFGVRNPGRAAAKIANSEHRAAPHENCPAYGRSSQEERGLICATPILDWRERISKDYSSRLLVRRDCYFVGTKARHRARMPGSLPNPLICRVGHNQHWH